MNLNVIKPVGLHVTGVIRFAAEGKGTGELRMLDHFDILGRSYEAAPDDNGVPALKPHPIARQLLEGVADAQTATSGAEAKLREIPVKLIFEKPENSLTARFEAFDGQLNRLVCVGDGSRCSRADVSTGTVAEEGCVGPDACSYANTEGVNCQLRVRLAVQIDGQDDPLSVFEFQSGGIHTYRNFASKLAAIKALTGRLRGIPLTIRSYERGSAMHGYQSFHVADLVLRDPGQLAVMAQPASLEGSLNFAALEEAVEQMRRDSPFALCDEADEGIVFFQPPPDRRVRQASPQKSAGPASIAAVVSAARAMAASGTAAESALAATVVATPPQAAEGASSAAAAVSNGASPIVIEPLARGDARTGSSDSAPTRRVRSAGPAKITSSEEQPPTPL